MATSSAIAVVTGGDFGRDGRGTVQLSRQQRGHLPFDRLFVAQALTEPLRLITHDEKVAAYSDTFVYF